MWLRIIFKSLLAPTPSLPETRSPSRSLVPRLEVSFPVSELVPRLEVSFPVQIIKNGKQNQDLQLPNHPASLYTRAGASACFLRRGTRLPQKNQIF